MGIFGGGGSLPPDQAAMQQQVGWYPRADMVLPTGSTQQQMYPTTGYNGNLTPAQAATVNQLGYYTPSSWTPEQAGGSILDKIGKIPGLLDKAGFKGTNPADAANAATQAAAAANARAAGGQGGGGMLSQLLGGRSLNDMLYDPNLALQVLFRGTPPVTGMSQIGGQPTGQRRY